MDLFASLKQRFSGQSSPPRRRSSDPLLQLGKFEKCWNVVREERDEEIRSPTPKRVTHTDIPVCLEQISQLLADEDEAFEATEVAPLMDLALERGIFEKLSKYALECDIPVGFRGYIIHFFAEVTQRLEARWLSNNRLYRPIMDLLVAAAADQEFNREYYLAFLVLSFNLSEKVAVLPELVPVFLAHDFFLLDYTLRYLHFPGDAGNYSRSAILNILSLPNNELQHFVIKDSGLAQIIASALGGLWSQLPQSLSSIDNELPTPSLDTLVLVLQFCNIMASQFMASRFHEGIGILIIETIQNDFLQKIVKHDFLERLDFDGTAISVMTYYRCILMNLEQGPLSSIFVELMLGEDTPAESTADLFLSIKDILLCRLNSMNGEVVKAALLLINAFLLYHPSSLRLFVPCLASIDVLALQTEIPQRMVQSFLGLLDRLRTVTRTVTDTLQTEVDFSPYINDVFGSSVSPFFEEEGHTDILIDSSPKLELINDSKVSPSSLTGDYSLPLGSIRSPLSPSEPGHESLKSPVSASATLYQILDPLSRDASLNKLIRKCGNFFTQGVSTNILITGIISTLAKMDDVAMFVWVFGDYPESGRDADSIPLTLVATLSILVNQVLEMANSIKDFEIKISETRRRLFYADGEEEHRGKLSRRSSTTSIADLPSPTSSSTSSVVSLSKPSFWDFVLGADEGKRSRTTALVKKFQPKTNFDDQEANRELLENVVLLEEFIKELIAIAHVQRLKKWQMERYTHSPPL